MATLLDASHAFTSGMALAMVMHWPNLVPYAIVKEATAKLKVYVDWMKYSSTFDHCSIMISSCHRMRLDHLALLTSQRTELVIETDHHCQ